MERNEEGDPIRLGGLHEDWRPELASRRIVGRLDGGESDNGVYVPPQTGDSDDECPTSSEEDSDDNGSADSEGDSDEIESDSL